MESWTSKHTKVAMISWRQLWLGKKQLAAWANLLVLKRQCLEKIPAFWSRPVNFLKLPRKRHPIVHLVQPQWWTLRSVCCLCNWRLDSRDRIMDDRGQSGGSTDWNKTITCQCSPKPYSSWKCWSFPYHMCRKTRNLARLKPRNEFPYIEIYIHFSSKLETFFI